MKTDVAPQASPERAAALRPDLPSLWTGWADLQPTGAFGRGADTFRSLFEANRSLAGAAVAAALRHYRLTSLGALDAASLLQGTAAERMDQAFAAFRLAQDHNLARMRSWVSTAIESSGRAAPHVCRTPG